jgi:glycosyltransferase involved in cell wall biosynthesis
MDSPVYILIRTSNRPQFFARMMETVKNQTYKNIVTIVHSDDPRDEYVQGDIILRGCAYGPAFGSGPYNLYNNRLLKAIPADKPGWFHFIDDDDEYASPDVIEKFVKASKRDHINVGRVERWNGTIWPKNWGYQKSFQTECFLVHTDHKSKAKWWGNKGGDHYYSKQLTRILPINWIDNLLICKAQEGKGHGRKFDQGNKKIDLSTVYKPGDKVPCLGLVPNRAQKKEERIGQGEIKRLKYEIALKLEKEGKVKITNWTNYVEKPVPMNIYNQ